MNKKKTLLIIAIFLWLCSCVTLFEQNINSGLKVLTVDATLSDIDDEQKIIITESVNSKGTAYSVPVQNVIAELIINNNEHVMFKEKGEGIYVLPSTFKLKSGEKYRLAFSKADGTKYESDEETLTIVPEIVDIRDEFKIKGIAKEGVFLPANYIYLDVKDPENEKNNYFWTWQLWEHQDICETCDGGRYYLNVGCRKEREYQGKFFDYYCDGNCWEIFQSTEINVLNDIYSNGKLISNVLVAKIPYYSPNGALIEVKQQSVSSAAYRYLKLLAEQTQNTGTLVDTPPAAIVGNIKNINNKSEAIAGFFMVTSFKTSSHWIDRKEPIEQLIIPVGLRDHPYTQEPPVPNEFGRPPLVKCELSKTRTPIKPKDWPN